MLNTPIQQKHPLSNFYPLPKEYEIPSSAGDSMGLQSLVVYVAVGLYSTHYLTFLDLTVPIFDQRQRRKDVVSVVGFQSHAESADTLPILLLEYAAVSHNLNDPEPVIVHYVIERKLLYYLLLDAAQPPQLSLLLGFDLLGGR